MTSLAPKDIASLAERRALASEPLVASESPKCHRRTAQRPCHQRKSRRRARFNEIGEVWPMRDGAPARRRVRTTHPHVTLAPRAARSTEVEALREDAAAVISLEM